MAAEIGLKAVMEMAGFTQGINKYNDMLGGASSNTDKHAGIMSKALAGIGTVLKTGVAVAAGGIAALTSAIAGAALASVSWAEKIDSVGDVLGTTAEESSALAVAAQHIGGNVEQLTSQMAILTKGLVTADGKIGPTGEALKAMGISFKDANGKMLPTTEILQKVADKIGKMPDGLEKTNLMMKLFGKSGKDMSDMMGALADGGMAEFDQMAKDMGLSMTDDAAAGAIEFNRSLNDLKMMAQGFLVQLGTEFMPMLQGLANFLGDILPIAINILHSGFEKIRPTIELITGTLTEMIYQITHGIEPIDAISEAIMRIFGMDAAVKFHEIANSVKDWLIPIITDLREWLAVNLPIAMAAISDFWKTTLWPAIQEIAKWIGENLPIAIAAVVAFIKDPFIPTLRDIWSFIKEKVIPIIADIIVWLATKLPPAIATAISWFNEHLLPALSEIWAFIKDPLLPILGQIITWLATAIKTAVETFVNDIWPKVKKAFVDIKDFIEDPLIPTFTKIVDWLSVAIGKAVDTFKITWDNLKEAFKVVSDWITTNLTGPDGVFTKVYDWLSTALNTAVGVATGILKTLAAGWQGILDVINFIIGAIQEVIKWINQVVEAMPDWLIPGSPTPMEMGLRGIAAGFMSAAKAASAFSGALGGLTPLNVGGLTTFAGAIMGRFKDKYTTPLDDKVKGLREELELVTEAMQDDRLSTEEQLNLMMRRAELEKELAATSQELNIQKERELALQKQLNDLAFLQAQMDFLSFLKENELNFSDILGNLQLGLNLDLPAFMDAITRALAALVANINQGLSGGGTSLPPLPPGDAKGFRGGGTSQIHNNKTVNVYMNNTIGGGMDAAMFRSEVLSIVTEALG
jgi:phage-related protein